MAQLVGGFLSLIERLISTPATGKNNKYLDGPFAPVHEEHEATPCKVTGQLPAALSGEFARNGPNPKLNPVDGYHWFDGDGMVHAVRIKNGTATYSSRYVNTVRVRTETAAGRALYGKFGEMQTRWSIVHLLIMKAREALGLCKLEDDSGLRGRGKTANTSLVLHANRLMALNEADLPYALKVMCDGVLETIGMLTFGGKLQGPFTAHPKIMEDGTMYAIGYDLEKKPYVTFMVVDSSGSLVRSFPVDIPAPVMMHDFAVTDRHAILLDLAMVMDPKKLFSSELPIAFDSNKASRFGVLPLDATSEEDVRWFTLPEPVMCFHTMNAWEEMEPEGSGSSGRAKAIHILLCEMKAMDLEMKNGAEKIDRNQLPDLVHYKMDLESGQVTKHDVVKLADTGIDFPQIARGCLGRPNKYGYLTYYSNGGMFSGFVKVDLRKETNGGGGSGGGNAKGAPVDRFEFGNGRYGGEMIFIPDPARAAEGAAPAEDAGFLTTFVLDDIKKTSEMVVWDAQNISKGPVTTITIPARIPVGFHAIWLTEKELGELQRQPEQQRQQQP